MNFIQKITHCIKFACNNRSHNRILMIFGNKFHRRCAFFKINKCHAQMLFSVRVVINDNLSRFFTNFAKIVFEWVSYEKISTCIDFPKISDPHYRLNQTGRFLCRVELRYNSCRSKNRDVCRPKTDRKGTWDPDQFRSFIIKGLFIFWISVHICSRSRLVNR